MELAADKKTQQEVEMDIIGQLVAIRESSEKVEMLDIQAQTSNDTRC